MKQVRRAACFALCLCLCACLSGCWNYRELESTGTVSCAAFDWEDGQWRVTAEIVNYAGANDKNPPKAIYVSSRGPTVFACVRDLIEQSSQKLYWGHASTFILSRSVASRGIAHVADFALRDHEIRPGTLFLVSLEPTARELLVQDTPNFSFTGTAIISTLSAQESTGKAPKTSVADLYQRQATPNQTYVLPTSSKVKVGNKQLLEVAGSARIRDGKLNGFLTPEETMQLLLITGKAKGGVLNVVTRPREAPHKPETTALDIKKSRASISPSFHEGRFAFDVTIDLWVNLVANEGKQTPDDGLLRALAQRQLDDELLRFMKRQIVEEHCDLFGLGEAAKQSLSKQYRAAEPDWDRWLSRADIKVRTTVHIQTESSITRSTGKEAN